MKKVITAALCALFFSLSAQAAENDIKLSCNGELLDCVQPPVVQNGRTLVPVRTVCDALGLDVDWDNETETIRICDELNLVTLNIGVSQIDVNDEVSALEAAPEIINGVTCVPIRAVVEPFGAFVGWNGKTRTVIISDSPVEDVIEPQNTAKGISGHSFYIQPDPEWGFASNGRGYCWVCSYAMVLSDLTDTRITPKDVADYNLSAGTGNGSYMASHWGIAANFGAQLVPALDESSAYFKSYDSARRGATYLNIQSDDDVRAALAEALSRNPHGVMVRFEGYPHTIVAVGYENGKIYFNDPAAENMENVEFSGTCLARSFKLTDISYIQALALK